MMTSDEVAEKIVYMFLPLIGPPEERESILAIVGKLVAQYGSYEYNEGYEDGRREILDGWSGDP